MINEISISTWSVSGHVYPFRIVTAASGLTVHNAAANACYHNIKLFLWDFMPLHIKQLVAHRICLPFTIIVNYFVVNDKKCYNEWAIRAPLRHDDLLTGLLKDHT